MKTLRILNERSGFLGLTVIDLGALGYFLILTHTALSSISLELFSFVLTGLLVILLIHVRLTERPKYLRDLLKYYVTRRKLN